MDIKPVGAQPNLPIKKSASGPAKKGIVRDAFTKMKNAKDAVGDKMKAAYREFRTKAPTNRAVSTLFALATVAVGIGGLATVGMTSMPTLAHMGITLASTFGCSYMSHKYA
ncbi:MAG: hypothetical protein K8T10_12240 [Candidatus Eremiobacteraeota bacterium]|nr:hypothetical protein [Candidatus Eremiobacteraeota bacterium]